MFELALHVTIAILIGAVVSASSVHAQQSQTNNVLLREYLQQMAGDLDCYFTFEDRPSPHGSFPWIAHITDFMPDPDITTIDALVAHLDQQLDGVKVVRSKKYPSIVHLIAEDLIEEGYVIEDTVTVEYDGSLSMLPDHLGSMLDERIKARTAGGFRELYEWDVTTEVEVEENAETVRNVLTGAVALEGYNRFLWEARRIEIGQAPKMLVRYFGRQLTPEDLMIATLEDYLREMGKRLDCYFIVEDRPDLEPEGEELIIRRREFIDDLEIATIDALVTYLDEQLPGVKVMRSTMQPSVVHLIAEDLLQQGYVMDEKVTLEFEGQLDYLPAELGTLLDDKVQMAADAEEGVFPSLRGVDIPEVEFATHNETVRNILTAGVPLEGHERVLWLSVQVEIEGSPRAFVGYYGSNENDEETDPEE